MTMHNNDMDLEQQQQRQEQIELHRLDQRHQSITDGERLKVYKIFAQYDYDRDGRISLSELKRLRLQGKCNNLNVRLIKHILRNADINESGYIEFEEFFIMYKANPWLFSDYLSTYCRLIVPRRIPDGDEVDSLYHDEVSFCPPPITMVIFSFLEILTFLFDIIYLRNTVTNRKIGESTSGPAATIFIYNPRRKVEAWRFITYMFVHVGINHIFWNLMIQILLGIALEVVHRFWRVAVIYLAGVIAGSIGTAVVSQNTFLAGASAGVYALISAHLATLILNWTEMRTALIQLIVFLIYAFADIGTSIYQHISNPNDKIGYMAHLSGALAGLLVGIGILRNLKVHKWERIVWWICIFTYFILMGAGILTIVLKSILK